MPASIWASEFRDEASWSPYPFTDASTLTDRTGTLTLDRDLFLDASFYPVGAADGLHVSAIDVLPRQVVLWCGVTGALTLCSARFDPLAPPAQLAVTDAYGRPAGLLIVDTGRAATAQTWAPGRYEFEPGAAEFVASCVLPSPARPLRGVLVGDRLLTGHVWLVGEGGVVLRSEGGGRIRVDVVGDPLSKRRECSPVGLFRAPRFVRTINGITPDATGEFQVAVGDHDAPDTVLRLVPDGPNALRWTLAAKRAGEN